MYHINLEDQYHGTHSNFYYVNKDKMISEVAKYIITECQDNINNPNAKTIIEELKTIKYDDSDDIIELLEHMHNVELYGDDIDNGKGDILTITKIEWSDSNKTISKIMSKKMIDAGNEVLESKDQYLMLE